MKVITTFEIKKIVESAFLLGLNMCIENRQVKTASLPGSFFRGDGVCCTEKF